MSFRQKTILGPETCEIRPKVGNRTGHQRLDSQTVSQGRVIGPLKGPTSPVTFILKLYFFLFFAIFGVILIKY